MTNYIVDIQARIAIDMVPDKRQVVTVGNVRQWLAAVEHYGIGDDAELVEGLLSIDMVSNKVETILCGECSPQKDIYDALVVLHECTNDMMRAGDHSH